MVTSTFPKEYVLKYRFIVELIERNEWTQQKYQNV